jgi:23S rRNA (cytidine1920-2'-O)/16S rRNA (cytidine1409-2'-O)-methyltransferase
MMRLDVYLFQNGYASSRERAKRLILEGAVTLDGQTVKKPSLEIEGEHAITVTEENFVGRGGEKLDAALRCFHVDPTGLCAIDIGASTGGFTDCLLGHGAKHVTAVDAGCGQLHPKLIADPRVTNIEKYNARNLSVRDVGCFDLAVMDVSFISATYIIPQFPALMNEGGEAICLVKPQFEVGRAMIGKGGIVRDPSAHASAIKRVCTSAEGVGLYPVAIIPSPIEGGDGNREFLLHLVRQPGRGEVLTDEQILKVTTK